MSLIDALYLVLLAAVTGYVLIARVPSLLHTPMLSGSNFIHGIVLAGAMLALSNATGMLETVIGFVAVTAASANVVGGFIVTDRMLNLFEAKRSRKSDAAKSKAAGHKSGNGGRQRPEDTEGPSVPAASGTLVDRRQSSREHTTDHG